MCKRGEIYYTNLGNNCISDKQCGIRPVIVVSNNKANKNSNIITVVPMTSKVYKKRLPTHVFMDKLSTGLDKDSIALAEQITAIDKDMLEDKTGEIFDELAMEQLTTAIQIQVGCYDEYN